MNEDQVVVYCHIYECYSTAYILEPKVLLNFVFANFLSNIHAGPDLEHLFDLLSTDSSGSGGSGLEEGPVMCFSSTNCEESNWKDPVMASSQEECCLMSPFQPRSFKTTKDTTGVLGARCVQCIGTL